MNASNQNTVTSMSALTTNPEVFHRIRSAIECNDYDEFKRLLCQPTVGVNDLDEIGGPSFLMIAAEVGSSRMIKELISKGADIDYQDNDYWTALIVATREGHTAVVLELIESGCNIELKDINGWNALMWASYKGRSEIAEILLKQNSSPNIFDNNNHMTPLCWASGRGFCDIVMLLLKHCAKVDIGDKYGTTPLIWACRKGHLDIGEGLLRAAASIDCVGMFGWSPLIVATRGNFSDVVELLLSYKPNVNICDPHGLTPLMTASKEGNINIVNALLSVHAYVNMSDKNGDSALTHAAKAGHLLIVEALIKAHADIDHQSIDRRTALYCAVDKGHTDVVKSLLKSNANMELATKELGDTALLKAVRNRKTQIVRMLLEKKAKVSVTDKYGDTALHIAARSQSKVILELILRNPKNSQLLYKPNKRGETAFSIDSAHQKPVLPTLFGAAPSNRRVLEKENQLGYDLYSSAIANLLSEPQLKTPICVGLFAKWGSGKSFLIGKLKDDLVSFSSCWSSSYLDDLPESNNRNGFTWTSALAAIALSILVGISVLVASNGAFLSAFISLLATLILCYTFLGIVLYCGHYEMSRGIKLKLQQLKSVLLVTFANPPKLSYDTVASLPVRFIFCDSPGVKVGSVGEGVAGSFSQFMCTVLDSLWQVLEDEFGYLSIRLYRVFRPKHIVSRNHWKWRRTCFIVPTLGLLMFLLITCSGLLVLYYISLDSEMEFERTRYIYNNSTARSDQIHSNVSTIVSSSIDDDTTSAFPLSSSVTRIILFAFASLIIIWIVANISIPFRIARELFFPIRRNRRLDGPAIKQEVDLISSCLFCFDAFDGRRQSRIALVLDALESVYESERLITFLEAINSHLANPSMSTHLNDPFVTILALDPHHHATSKSREYLKTIVHLPFYLQNSQLRRVRIAESAAMKIMEGHAGSTLSIVDALTAPGPSGVSNPGAGDYTVLKSTNASLSRSTSKLTGLQKKSNLGKSQLTLKPAESVASLYGPSGEMPTKVILADDYFSDINPKSLRRIMNIAYVQGRLLKAFNIDFHVQHLTLWVNITDQFPLRASAIMVYCELMESRLNDETATVKSIYEKIAPIISSSEFTREIDTIYRREDSDEKKFLLFAAGISILHIKVFSPFTINVDPNYRRMLQDFFTRNQNSSTLFGVTSGTYRTNSICSISVPFHSTRDNLADLSVDGVISMLRSIEGFSCSNTEKYTKALRDNNINGKVLAAVNGCEKDLDELKTILAFSFGDWLLFKRIILLGKVPSTHQLVPSTTQINLHQMDNSSTSTQPVPQITTNNSGRALLDMKSRLLEKQVTLEEAALASSIIVESPSTDAPSSSSPDAPQALEPSPVSGRFSSEVPSRKTSALSDQISLTSEPAEVEVLYIGSSGPGQKLSPSIISYQAESVSLVDRTVKPPKDLPSTQSVTDSPVDMRAEPTERTPLMSPSRHSIASSGSTSVSLGSPGSTSSSSRKKGPLERQRAAAAGPDKRETNF